MIRRKEYLSDDVVDEANGLVCTFPRHFAAVDSELIDGEYPLQPVVMRSLVLNCSHIITPRLPRPTRTILTSQYSFQTGEGPFDNCLRRVRRGLPSKFNEAIARRSSPSRLIPRAAPMTPARSATWSVSERLVNSARRLAPVVSRLFCRRSPSPDGSIVLGSDARAPHCSSICVKLVLELFPDAGEVEVTFGARVAPVPIVIVLF